VNNLTDNVDIDPLELLHNRTGCTSMAKLIEAYRQQLITHSGLLRYHLTKKANKKGYRHKNFLCGICARTKITRKSFGRKNGVTAQNYLDKITCDISVYLNCPSREG
jgi:hypothetical protein